MKLKEIQINNYRSIPKDTRITMTNNCKILVGINGSGKSNILKAISLLSPEIEIDKKDIREASLNDPPVKESSIVFIFEFDENELKTIFKNITKKMLTENYNDYIFKKPNKLNLFEFMKKNNSVLYEIDLKKSKKQSKYFSLSDEYTVFSYWKKPSSSGDDVFMEENGKEISLKTMKIVNGKTHMDIEKYLEDLLPEDINEMIGKEYCAHIDKNLPECVFWKYENQNILPSRIEIEKFSSDPNICIPLKYMFNLSGYSNISKAFDEAKNHSDAHGISNLLKKVSKKTTSFFREVWKDNKIIKFSLVENGNFINIAIEEGIRHDFDRRSDGFKRFTTFLLMISAKVKNGTLKDALILIDEPDMGLHITAKKYLKNELMNISKNNYVIYSTHSIFMIDDKILSRNLIVKKEDEKTKIIEAKESNIFDEEVLFRALGYTVLKNIKEKNIIFEGWRDKKLFNVAIKRIHPDFELSGLGDKFNNIGLTHSKGVRDISYISSTLECADSKVLVLSDNDEPAKRSQTSFIDKRIHGTWKRYDEILENCTQKTGEDFINKNIIMSTWNELFLKYNIDEIKNIEELNDTRGVIHVLKKKSRDTSNIIDIFKERLFSKLESEDIERDYYEYLSKLPKILNEL